MEVIRVLMVISGCIIVYLYFIWKYERKEKERYKAKYDEYLVKYWKMQDQITTLNHYLLRLKEMQNLGGNAYNKDLMDAVKKGMIASHPDKGGNADDFTRFRKVYENLKGAKH